MLSSQSEFTPVGNNTLGQDASRTSDMEANILSHIYSSTT